MEFSTKLNVDGGHRSSFLKKYCIFLIDFVLANSADPFEMPHFAAFHLGLHCLQFKYLFQGISSLHRVKNNKYFVPC